jgi:signal transduction histidine kinase/CheY-like chemotaxis protein
VTELAAALAVAALLGWLWWRWRHSALLERERRLEAHQNEVRRLESLGLLASGIAHDFNNALSVILGNVSLALAELPPDSPLRRRLARVRSAARHAVSLTEQMLTYSGDSAVTRKPLDLERVLDETRELLEATVGEHCALQFELAPQILPVRGDATQLRQVLVNLVGNAAEALAGQPGSVQLRSGSVRVGRQELEDGFGNAHPEPGPYAFFEVADSGPGMDEATQSRIFEPFYTTRAAGRGLGLAAVLGIVRGHDGVIQLESAPGRGSSFRVLLPLLGGEPAAAGGPPQAALRADVPATVLVIDDEEPVREIAQAFLTRSGFRVVAASGGREGLEILRARGREIEAVLLDLSMPEQGGEETLREIRRMRPDLPVIVATGYDEAATRARLAAEAGTPCIRKPYAPEVLADALRAALAGTGDRSCAES